MDQNSTNSSEKRNWRERLGIGGKDMPRISGEFTKAPETIEPVAAPVRAPQSVAKPAPMAPRLPMKSAASPAARPQQQVPPQGTLSPAPTPDALAEKLRSQRAAAERLAEQRVTAAKLRAEGAIGTSPPPVVAAAPAEKPKFTFADDDSKPDFGREPRALPPGRPPQRPAAQQPQLSPPRPPLGGQPRLPAGASAALQPQYRPQPPRGYTPSAYVPPPPLAQPQRSFNGPMSQPQTAEPRLHAPRVGPEAYRRSPQDDHGYAGYEPPHRPLQRPGALRAQPQAYDDDYGDEIFEDAPPPRSSRRASAHDYNQAYRETEGAYPDDRRRSSGPWLLLLFLMLAAGAAGAGVWYYQSNVKTAATTASPETAPVVAAPEQSAKSAPEQPLDGQSGPSPSKKQIYDRIIGENEVLGGQVVPTEEPPMQPESLQGDAEEVVPASDSPDTLSEGGDALPLPMPPPVGTGNDTQGALSTPPPNKTVALSSPAKATNSTGLAVDIEIAPVPGENAAAANTQQATPPAETAPAMEEIVNEEPVAPVIKKPVLKKTKPVVEQNTELGAAPVVLVPPSNSVDTGQGVGAPLVVDQQPIATQPAPVVKKKKTLFGLFKGTNDQNVAAPTATAVPAAPEQQVAAIPPPAPIQQPAAPAQVASAGSGYYVQLASFKSQAEASTEFGRLRAKYASILGTLPSTVNPATVGGSTRYRLAVGPVASRDQATRICSSLVAAGERDCLVRKQ